MLMFTTCFINAVQTVEEAIAFVIDVDLWCVNNLYSYDISPASRTRALYPALDLTVILCIHIGVSAGPTLKQLQEVTIIVAPKWEELGSKLLNKNICRTLKMDYHDDAAKCCSEMFQRWLQMDMNPSWRKLILALESVDLNSLAQKLEETYIGELLTNSEPHRLVV